MIGIVRACAWGLLLLTVRASVAEAADAPHPSDRIVVIAGSATLYTRPVLDADRLVPMDSVPQRVVGYAFRLVKESPEWLELESLPDVPEHWHCAEADPFTDVRVRVFARPDARLRVLAEDVAFRTKDGGELKLRAGVPLSKAGTIHDESRPVADGIVVDVSVASLRTDDTLQLVRRHREGLRDGAVFVTGTAAEGRVEAAGVRLRLVRGEDRLVLFDVEQKQAAGYGALHRRCLEAKVPVPADRSVWVGRSTVCRIGGVAHVPSGRAVYWPDGSLAGAVAAAMMLGTEVSSEILGRRCFRSTTLSSMLLVRGGDARDFPALCVEAEDVVGATRHDHVPTLAQ